ncbi:recombinase family protein [Acidithrix sp. C25]|uniref:recombinase family protein n=1 Tax=Acidithrix sp. C25 TaxID=1671482 RepID=UPI00191BA198|nr:recombinase family protein [Acidithrix sp. C25]
MSDIPSDRPTLVGIPAQQTLDFSPQQSVNEVNVTGGKSPMYPATATPTTNPLDMFAQALAPKVAVSYLRVSTRDQARRGGGDDEGFSIPAQRDANKRRAASLGAIVIKEFVDRGASARSANRPELQRMLEYLADHEVDYVIVHKLDRLARNRADDVEITKALDASNVRLVSTTESIDETPSGMLLHGIMSSIAEFYSRNLAAEVMKGMSQKARSGGTVGRAPLGYRNHRSVDSEGREVRTVVIDQERAPLIKQAFELYATGSWTVAALAEHLNQRGLTTTPTQKLPSRPITEGLLHKVLTNPYFKGLTKFQGALYQGRHETLVDEVTWQRVQDILTSHNNGERTRKHPHFLKSTVYCGQCGERLMVQRAKSASGMTYPYFYCAGRHSKRTTCTQRAALIYEVETKLEQHYQHIQLDTEFRGRVEAMIREEFVSSRAQIEEKKRELKREQEKLERQRQKLMEAHYAGAIPVDLLGSEQERIGRALQKVIAELSAIRTEFEIVEVNLKQALDLTVDCGAAYENAPDHIKKLFNQAFFEKVFVFEVDDTPGEVRLEAELKPPFDTLFGDELKNADATRRISPANKKPAGKSSSGLHNPAVRQVNCLSNALMVGAKGLEPPTC